MGIFKKKTSTTQVYIWQMLFNVIRNSRTFLQIGFNITFWSRVGQRTHELYKHKVIQEKDVDWQQGRGKNSETKRERERGQMISKDIV